MAMFVGLLRRGRVTRVYILICLASALGLPVSWRKLKLGYRLRWIGWDISLRVAPCTALPEEKRQRLLAALQRLCVSGARF